MSYDLYFWRQASDVKRSPSEVLDALSEDVPVEGIASFPRDMARRVLRESFPEIEDGDMELTWEGDGSYFQISFSHATERDIHLIIANCGYELLKGQNAVNRLIETCASIGCALYDPQTDKRFEQREPTRGKSLQVTAATLFSSEVL